MLLFCYVKHFRVFVRVSQIVQSDRSIQTTCETFCETITSVWDGTILSSGSRVLLAGTSHDMHFELFPGCFQPIYGFETLLNGTNLIYIFAPDYKDRVRIFIPGIVYNSGNYYCKHKDRMYHRAYCCHIPL